MKVNNSARQIPSSSMVSEPDTQSMVSHLPTRSMALSLAQLRHPDEPPVKHDLHEESHDLHVPDEPSKYSVLVQVGRQRPSLVSTGRSGGQLLHWLKPVPEQVAQSGWQGIQDPFDEKELVGQEVTHRPLKAD